jgi:hypothetical protein
MESDRITMSTDDYVEAWTANLPIVQELVEMVLEAIPDLSDSCVDNRKSKVRAAADSNTMCDATLIVTEGYLTLFAHERTKMWTVADKLHSLYCAVFRPFRNIPCDEGDCPYLPNSHDETGRDVFTIPGAQGFDEFAGALSPRRALVLIAAASLLIRLLLRESLLVPPSIEDQPVQSDTASWLAFIRAAFVIEVQTIEAYPSPAASPDASPERAGPPQYVVPEVPDAAVRDCRIQERLDSLKRKTRRT